MEKTKRQSSLFVTGSPRFSEEEHSAARSHRPQDPYQHANQNPSTQRMKPKGEKVTLRRMFAVFLFVLGLSLVLYPSLAQYVNNLSATKLVSEYFNSAIEPTISPDNPQAGAGAGAGADASSDEIFGGISIPKLKLELPIYIGSTDENLSKGIAHLEGTSLPVGGKSTHSVLCGHNGAVTNEWFTHIDELTEGDLFYIKTTEQLLTYKVIGYKTISPNDTSELYIKEGQDLVTLLTCIDSGTNRLIVTGERVLSDSWTEK